MKAGIDFQSEPDLPEKWQHKKVQAAYYAIIEQIDTEFGRLIDFLYQTEQRQNTIVIFMSDHGEMLGDHGLMLKGCRFFRRSGASTIYHFISGTISTRRN